ncbi:iron ABC transporter permease, partial [Escherichia coli]|nr:iron ABC transporter permease [Escherichia coli]
PSTANCSTVAAHAGGVVIAPTKITDFVARALLQDRPILVLDEATAFADPENEAPLLQALAAAMRGRTVIMVAHRLSMLTQADVILLFSDGQLREM